MIGGCGKVDWLPFLVVLGIQGRTTSPEPFNCPNVAGGSGAVNWEIAIIRVKLKRRPGIQRRLCRSLQAKS
jgi:hypothetical protein